MIKKLLYTTKKSIKKILCLILYSYPGYIVFDFISRLTGYKKEKQSIYEDIGYYPNLKNPHSFNEKILWKKIYDRNPLLPIVSDKYRVRQYLKEVLGQKEAEKILVPLLYVTDNPVTIPFSTLKEEYVIKPNNAAGKIILAENIEGQKRYTIIDFHKTTILSDCKSSREEIVKVCKKWLSTPYGFRHYEWAYQKIKRKILIEKLLRNTDGKIPEDYKFHIFHGKCYSILVIFDKFTDKSLARYSPDWEYLYINITEDTKLASHKERPENLKSMVDIAELLGKPFDYIRADLYLVDGQIYFGEFTNYPTSGHAPFIPASLDFLYGSQWKLIPKYWKQYNF